MKISSITPSFVDLIPESLGEGILYISERYKIAVHRCCCGCGEEVVTPLSPADWTLKKTGKTVSLTPSIGNWMLACKSHYVIRNNRVIWAEAFSAAQINRVLQRDKADKKAYLVCVNKEKDREALRPSYFIKKLWGALVGWWRS